MQEETSRPAHHLPNGSGFVNPWPSFSHVPFHHWFQLLWGWNHRRAVFPAVDQRIPVRKFNLSQPLAGVNEKQNMQVTWLGHAAFSVRLGVIHILTDPVFSHRCSPSQWVGPARYTEPPCSIQDLAPVDVVLISHNHYDHLDVNTILQLGNHPHYFVPLGNKEWFQSLGITNVTELDWWQSSVFSLPILSTALRITCTPCQHFSSRSAWDRNRTLWASWAVQSVVATSKQDASNVLGSFYFAGDTGYCSVPRSLGDVNPHDPEKYSGPELATCPAFKAIGSKLGPFDLGLIPIGAYSPRYFMSPVHCSPEDAVCVHMDVRSQLSLGMHWGTWMLTDEDPTEPPQRVAQEMKRRGLDPNTFRTLEIGETLNVDCGGKEEKI